MNIDPANAASVQIPIVNQSNDIAMGNDTRLIHLLIGGQQLSAASKIANEEFSITNS
jgi:hypothetical protein